MSITSLPPEVIIRILSYTPIKTIISFSLVSTPLYHLVSANENQIYQAGAKFHGFVKTPQVFGAPQPLAREILNCDITGWLANVSSWKEFCRRHFLLEYAWIGNHGALELPIGFFQPSTLSNVHRFAIDDVKKIVICTTSVGGLIAASIDTGETVWQLPTDYVPGYAHMEYDQGFLVFLKGNDLEVWRRSADYFNLESYLPSRPHPTQLEASPYAVAIDEAEPLPSIESIGCYNYRPKLPSPPRGVHLPFSLFSVPARVRSFRLAYPYLLAGVETTKQAYIWDVTQAALIQTIDISIPSLSHLERIQSVDLRGDLVSICWTSMVVVYRRPTEEKSLGSSPDVVFSMKSESAVHRDVGRSAAAGVLSDVFLVVSWLGDPSLLDPTRTRTTMVKKCPVRWGGAMLNNWDRYDSAILSEDGRDLVVANAQGSLIYIPDFSRTPGQQQSTRRSFMILFSEIADNEGLTFDGNRILLALESGIYSINVRDRTHEDGHQPDHTPEVAHLTITNSSVRLFSTLQDQTLHMKIHAGTVWFTFPAPRTLYRVVFANENQIYRAAAKFHGLVKIPQVFGAPQPLAREILNRDITGWLADVSSWKEFCEFPELEFTNLLALLTLSPPGRRHFLLEYAWTGNLGDLELPIRFFRPSTLSKVHRFAIDDVEKIVICSTSVGGLIAVTIDTGETVWQLPTVGF
ncbi:hypothetical protein FRC04_006775 [Tulasnella sp. 424]|nr:hypothetical protein FRC04_006775 [Tulasnella sp. 424]KAG8974326.1 hypothetical protein FRC05_007632 [Tulasnella sp. 425]